MNSHDPIDPKLKARLGRLRQVPPRNPQAASRGRARFLAEAAGAVSRAEGRRHRDWRPFSRKETFPMNAVLSVIVALALLFGGSATVYAAQDDLPTEPLYGIKLATEDARLWLNTDPQQEVALLMAMVQTRAQEMNMLAAQGIEPPAKLRERMEQHIHLALQIAAGMDDPAMNATLAQIHTTLHAQLQIMQQTQDQTGADEPVLLQTRSMIEQRLRLIEDSLNDPQGFRNTVQSEEEDRYGQEDDQSPVPGEGQGAGEPGGPQDTPGPDQEPGGNQGPNKP